MKLSLTHNIKNENRMDLSIIIISWNAKEFLKQCLQSIYETVNTSVAYEIIVVDNDSSDNSPDMVKKEFPYVKLICNGDNLGFAKANNIGIKQSSGRYLCIINSDVKLQKYCLYRMMVYMDHNPEIGMLGPKVLNPDQTLQYNYKKFPTYWNTLCRSLALDTLFPKSRLFGSRLYSLIAIDSPCSLDVLVGCFWMVRRKALGEVGLLDEQFFMYGEDIDLCKRFVTAGWEVVYFPDADAIHYGGSSSSNAPIKFYIEMKRSSFLYWKKYHGIIGKIYIYFTFLLSDTVRIIRGLIMYIIKPSERKKFKYKVKRSIASMCWLLHISNLK